MSILNNSLLLGADAGAAGYQISRSLRFNSADSAYLSRTPASAGNRKTFTFSCWIKRSALGSQQQLFGSYNYPSPAYYDTGIALNASDQLYFFNYDTSAWNGQLTTAAVFRDTAAYYHVVVSCDTNAAAPVKIYVNGAQQTLSGTQPSASSNTAINYTSLHAIGTYTPISGNTLFFSGYLADIHFIDGQALTPSSFAETNATTGQWVPKAYTGTYGTNGFRLDFSDNSAATATTLGKDRAGSNNWTPNNLSVTAGAGNDSLVDTPTSYGTDTGAGGEVRGNYCTLNPLFPSAAVTTNGNLTHYGVNAGKLGTMAFPSTGKWYYELTMTQRFGNYWSFIGIQTADNTTGSNGFFQSDDGVSGGVYLNGVKQVSVNTGSDGDICGLLWDADTRQMSVFRNGSQLGTTLTLPAGTYFPWVSGSGLSYPSSAAIADVNFGQRPWAYPANAAGAKALCDTNLPAPVVAKPSTVMDVKLWTGNSGTQNITGLAFSPDLAWVKGRTGILNHVLSDTIRGANLKLASNTTGAETGTDNGTISAFNSDGITVAMGTGTYPGYETNLSTYPYVGWFWDAGSSTVTNTQGSITSQVRANPSAGFSIVTYTGTATTGSQTPTVGHGLNVTPKLVITKRRDGASDWVVQTDLIPQNYLLYLNSTAAQTSISGSGVSNIPLPTSSVFTAAYITGLGVSGQTHVAYCFAPVAGYSAFGSYTGNGSTDGPFVYTGHRVRWLLVKNATNGGSWVLHDTTRSTYNVSGQELLPDSSGAEYTFTRFDFLSNGFKGRSTNNASNTNGDTYIYAAFAENPFQYARAR